MNVQSERLENHQARLTVTVEPEQWEQAKKDAARDLSKNYRIKGFRKGKAPYNIVVRYLGEGAIVEQAMENLGNVIYPQALDEAEIQPYTSGAIEDFKLEPQPTYIFTVPLRPEVELGDYRAIRADFEAPEVSDEEVEKAMRSLQQREALVEDSASPVQVGDRVTVDLHSEFADGEEPSDDDEDAEAGENEAPKKGDNFIHRHDAELNLVREDEPVLPGFIDALVGAEKDEDVEFELTVPEDDPDYEDIAGRKIHFHVTVNNIQNVTLPELNDDLAARLTEDEEEPLTLLQLRMRVRENLQAELVRNAEGEYADRILDQIVEGASIAFPDAMVTERIHDMIQNFDNQLRQQGMDLETYQQVTGITHEDLHEQYHDDAIRSLERTLVLGEVIQAENVTVTDADIEEQINATLAQFGEQAASLRQFFDTPQQRDNIANSLLYDRVMSRLAKIGKGESLEEPEEEGAEAASDEGTETTGAEDIVAEDVTEAEAELEEASEEIDETEAVNEEEAD